jgi:transcriptional regulator with XRE-family HTH domain
MDPINIVGPQVRAFRLKAKLRQDDLVARCGVLEWNVSRGTIAKIEAQVRCVSDAELFILAKALRTSLDSLYPADLGKLLAQLNQAETD